MRGARRWWRAGHRAPWLIPAYAGSTRVAEFLQAHWGAHPRSRGEHQGKLVRSTHPGGSSPLTRGALWGGWNRTNPPGLIPAHAGSTRQTYLASPQYRAHPRSRGEHTTTRFDALKPRGSSPLTRGALPLINLDELDVGLIPAHAGSTWPCWPN